MKEAVSYSIIGLGKLGSSMAAGIASGGFDVIGVDVDPRAVDLLNKGCAPVKETGLDEMTAANKKRLRATSSYSEALLNSDVTFVIVPTPSDENGSFSLLYLKDAFKEIGRSLALKNRYHLVVLTSTVLPGSIRYGLLPLLEGESGKKCGADFGLCYSPEFIALGSIIKDFLNPDFTLVGEYDEQSGRLLEECYSRILRNKAPCKRMSIENAELTKIALNSFVTTKIAFANMLAELCEKIPGGDVDVVTNAIGTDKRVGSGYFKGALGYGGPCFPRDNLALNFIAEKLGTRAELAVATHNANRTLVRKIIKRFLPGLKGDRTAAVLGLAYKPLSDVVEESQGIFLARGIAEAGARVSAYDPLAGENAILELPNSVTVADSMEKCISRADLIFVTLPYPEFGKITPEHFKGRRVTVVDFWRILEGNLSGHKGIEYIPAGKSTHDKFNERRLALLWG